MSENKYGTPWEYAEVKLENGFTIPRMLKNREEVVETSGDFKRAIACVNLVGDKEPGDCMVVDKNSDCVHDKYLWEDVEKIQRENSDLKAKLAAAREGLEMLALLKVGEAVHFKEDGDIFMSEKYHYIIEQTLAALDKPERKRQEVK